MQDDSIKPQAQKVIYTGDIPQCPHCKIPTKRTSNGCSQTSMYYPPMYDENGINTNPGRNRVTSQYHCYGCNKDYFTSGNHADGFYYL